MTLDPTKTLDLSDPLGSRLLQLSKIAGALNTFNTASLKSSSSSSISEEAEATLALIRELAGSAHSVENVVAEMKGRLSADEYVLPRELSTVHSRVLRVLSQEETLKSAAYSGLILSGMKGSGKSEYPLFLRSLLDQTPFFKINPNILRGHSNPVSFLEAILTELQSQALTQSKIAVLFLDEFDSMITAGGRSFNKTKVSNSDTVNSRHSISTSIKEETLSLDVDPLGSQLLNTLKSLVGSTQLDRVFLIATTNLTDLPDPLFREGRLEKIDMGPLGWSYPKNDDADFFIYDTYRDIAPRIVDILNASHFRIKGVKSPVLDSLRANLSELFKALPNHIEKINNRPKSTTIVACGSLGERSLMTSVENAQTLEAVLKFFDCDKKNISRSLGIRFNHTLDHFRISNGVVDQDASMEIKSALSLTPASIAAYFKLNQDKFESYETAKLAVRDILFPQLRGYTSAIT
jgi:hypothetical protein